MIKKLRKKFILINMLFVFIVLLAVFITVFISSSRTLSNDIGHSLTQAVSESKKFPGHPGLESIDGNIKNNPSEGLNEKPESDPKFIAIDAYLIDSSGYPTQTLRSNGVVDEDNLNEVLSAVLECSDEKVGILNEYNLYYYKRSSTNGYYAVSFADAGYYFESMSSLLFTSLVIGFFSLVAFLFISIFLSKWALKPVEKAWTQQKQFIADASHELKTPLTVILANTKILSQNKNDRIEQQIQWVDSTEEEAENMKKLVESLLFLARSDAESEQTKLITEVLNFSEITENAALQFEPVAYEQKIELNSKIDGDIMINGDASQLKQLLHILLDNACKYTSPGGNVLIELKKGELTVFNSGTPIPQENLPYLFERFYRSDKARSDSSSFGLGLSIAKRIALNHSGDLRVESSAELGGTKFIFTF